MTAFQPGDRVLDPKTGAVGVVWVVEGDEVVANFGKYTLAGFPEDFEMAP